MGLIVIIVTKYELSKLYESAFYMVVALFFVQLAHPTLLNLDIVTATIVDLPLLALSLWVIISTGIRYIDEYPKAIEKVYQVVVAVTLLNLILGRVLINVDISFYLYALIIFMIIITIELYTFIIVLEEKEKLTKRQKEQPRQILSNEETYVEDVIENEEQTKNLNTESTKNKRVEERDNSSKLIQGNNI